MGLLLQHHSPNVIVQMLLGRLGWLAAFPHAAGSYVLVDPSDYDPSYTAQKSFDSARSGKECFCGTWDAAVSSVDSHGRLPMGPPWPTIFLQCVVLLFTFFTHLLQLIVVTLDPWKIMEM